MGVEQRSGRAVEGVPTMTMDETAATVRPATAATHAAEIQARWAWVEPTVWNLRMLTALENGVKGGKWFSLIDKVHAMPNLRAACTRVKANAGAAGVDRQTSEMFERHVETKLPKLSQELRNGNYRPQPVRRQWIPKPGKGGEKRPLGIPTVRDRVAQAAVRNVLEPICEKDFAAHSYGFRPRRGGKDALRRVSELLEQGYTWVVAADLKSYFDTIPQSRMLERVRQKVSDGRVLGLLQAYLQQPIMDELTQWTPESGTPQGAGLSPLLSNIYLDPLDHQMAEAGYEMVRYADDFVSPRPASVSPLAGEPLTGEPYAGDPPVRFGGRGDRATGSPYPYPTRSPHGLLGAPSRLRAGRVWVARDFSPGRGSAVADASNAGFDHRHPARRTSPAGLLPRGV